jgi:DNA-binding XRE family transcriptional regulator
MGMAVVLGCALKSVLDQNQPGDSHWPRRKNDLKIEPRWTRALLRWTADDLAREAALRRNTILRAEVADDQTSLTAANDLAVRRALEAAGVEFIDENGGGPGVRLRQRRPKAPKK